MQSVRDVRWLTIEDCGRKYVPDQYAVKTEDYPLSRRLLLYTPDSQIRMWLRPFLKFAQGQEGQRIVRDEKLVDLSVEEVGRSSSDEARNKMIQQGNYIVRSDIENFQRVTRDARRLSIAFRFQPRTAVLDSRGTADIERLREYIRTLVQAQLSLVG